MLCGFAIRIKQDLKIYVIATALGSASASALAGITSALAGSAVILVGLAASALASTTSARCILRSAAVPFPRSLSCNFCRFMFKSNYQYYFRRNYIMKDMKELLHSAHLTKTQKIIAEYVLDNASEACFMTSTEIALKLGVSESSVIRFSRTIGFDGFMDFQKALRKDYQDKVLSISSSITVPSQRIAKQAKLDTSSDYINWHFKNAAHNLEEIFIQNSIETFEQAADLIVSSKHKYIAATRGNICLADFFLLYLKQMVPHVTMTTTTSMSPIDHMCNISHTDCLVLFSFPRYSSQDEVTAEMAHDAGASIIVITDKPSSLLAKYADILLTVPVDSNTFFNSMIGPQFVTEALLEIISHRAKGIEKRLNIIDKYLNKLGNY